MVHPVLWVLLGCVYLELLDLKESRDRWASLDSQVTSLQAEFVSLYRILDPFHMSLGKTAHKKNSQKTGRIGECFGFCKTNQITMTTVTCLSV